MGNRVERMIDIGVAGLHRLLSKRELIEGANTHYRGGRDGRRARKCRRRSLYLSRL